MENNPWERWPGEPEKAFAAFVKYRDTPAKERSLRKCVQEEYGVVTRAKLAYWEKWSRDWRWQFRVKAWADEQDRVAREAQLAEIKSMNRRHAQIGMSLQSKAAERLQKLQADELSTGDVLRFFSEAVKLERIARGEPETIARYDNKQHRDDFSDEELAAIAARGGFVATSTAASPEEPDDVR